MADTAVVITAGTGTNIDTRTEATNGNHRQVVVLGDPTTNDGVAPVDGTKGLSVDVKESVLPTGASTAANQSTIIGHVDGIETLLGTIDTDTGNIATEVAGLLTDTELRATPVPVSGSVIATQATGTNLHVVVDSAPTTAVTGTFYQATQPVSATDLDIRNLTNVDVVTAELSAVDNAVLDTIAAKDFATQTTLATINSKLVTGTDIGDVTINNSTGAAAVNIQDGGNTITVDGTVAVTNSDITSIKAAVEILDNAISGSEMQVDVVGALPAGTNAIGKLSANSGVDIGDVDVTSVSGTVTTKGIPSDIDANGGNTNHADKYYTNAGAVTDGIIWSPAAGKRWHVLNLTISVSAAATVTIEDDLAAGDNTRLKFEFAANSGITLKYDKEHPFSSTEDAADLLITTTAGNVYVQALGYEI